ncbi:hypothetical protein LPJ79_000994 [Coemansia sp. RSA 1821]|nr:hypothetical protein LPJ79_000994 [Coemansia sp. RSA 1821]
MASTGSAPNANAAAEFWEYFQQQKSQIQSLDASAAWDQLRALDQSLREAMIFLPTYDQKQLSQDLEALRQLLMTRKQPRFRFKSTKSKASAPAIATTEPSSDPLPSQSNQNVIANRSFEHIVAQPDVNCQLSDLENCLIDLRLITEQTQLNCHRIRNSVIVCGKVAGSATIRDSCNCIVVLDVAQLRFEGCSRICTFVSSASDPVIERSDNMRFASFPQNLACSGMSLYPVSHVQDFSWLRRQHSPNWSLIDNPDIFQPLWQMLHANEIALDCVLQFIDKC